MTLKPSIEILEENTCSFPQYRCLKAMVDGIVVGSVCAYESEGTCFISGLVVNPDYRGIGIGSRLLLAIERPVRDRVKRFELMTDAINQKSLSWYQNLGYTVFGRSHDQKCTGVVLEKRCIDPQECRIHIARVQTGSHRTALLKLVKEYFDWGNRRAIEKHNFEFDIDSMYLAFLSELPKYAHPDGVLMLIAFEGKFIGMGGFRRINDTVGELKRVYLQEKYRGNKLGDRLLCELLKKAREYGFKEMRLESARYMVNGYALYAKNGFKEMAVYKEVAAGPEFRSMIYCMHKKLCGEQ